MIMENQEMVMEKYFVKYVGTLRKKVQNLASPSISLLTAIIDVICQNEGMQYGWWNTPGKPGSIY